MDALRHSAIVRITHWITAGDFIALLVSGMAILLAHPRLYWGETGGVGTPSLIDLPLPFLLTGQSGWGRSLHFLSAWICVLTGLIYGASGFLTRHFREHLVPRKADFTSAMFFDHLRWRKPNEKSSLRYNGLQRLAYLTVVFILFPAMIWTGLAMSPAITTVFPVLVTLPGGQQSARTIHFFVAAFLVLFLLVHIAMVCRAGLRVRLGAMIIGRSAAAEERV